MCEPPIVLPPPLPPPQEARRELSPISERVAEVQRLLPGPQKGILGLVQLLGYRWEMEALKEREPEEGHGAESSRAAFGI